jgi:hypothetical protein
VRRLGKESVSINGNTTISKTSLWWFAPRFEISHNGEEYIVEVRVWPWMSIRSFRIERNGETIFVEGQSPYRVSFLTEATQLLAFYTFLIVLLSLAFFTALIWIT